MLTPIQSRAWNGASAPPLVRSVNGFVNVMTDLRRQLAPGTSNYYFFGRFFFAVYLLALVGLWAFHATRFGGRHDRERRWFRVLAAALAVGAVADTGPYWGGLESPFAATFLVEELALLTILVGAVMYGRALLRSRSAPGWLGWLFIIAAPGAAAVTWLSGYFPHGPMLLFAVASAGAGVVAVVGFPGRVAERPEGAGG